MTRAIEATARPRGVLVLVAAALGLGLLTACSAGSSASATPDEPTPHGWAHVHNLVVDGNRVLLGTHEGLWEMTSGQDPTLVSRDAFDVMGLTRDGTRWLASGHPGTGMTGPADLGLLESVDDGRTWRPVSLMGSVDFHRLAAAGPIIIGVSAHDGALLRSTDHGLTWTDMGAPPVFDIAIDPANGTTVLATTEDGPVRSVDGGVTFAPIAGAPLLALLAWTDPTAVGVDVSGQVYRSADGGGSWTSIGSVGGQPSAIAASGTTVAVLVGDALLVSTDEGLTFTDPPHD